MASEEMLFCFCFTIYFANLAFWLSNSEVYKKDTFGRGLLKEHVCKTFVKFCSEMAKKASFHFSHFQ